MLNGYNRRFTGSDRRSYILIHPSSRSFSVITKHTFLIMCNIIGVLVGSLIGATLSGTAPVAAFPVLPIVIMLMIRSFASYRVLGDTYNMYLLPVEQAFNKMNKEDRKRYAHHLEDAYRNCSRDVEFDRKANDDVLELFDLTAHGSKEVKDQKTELELELEAVRAKIQTEKEQAEQLAKIRDEERQILKEIEGRINEH